MNSEMNNSEIFNKAINKAPPAQVSYRTEWLKARNLKAENLTLYPVTGNGMKPMFNGGDYVMLDSSKTNVENHKTYGLMIRGDFKLRKLAIMESGDLNTYCTYKHAKHDDEIIKKSDIKNDVLIIGLAIHRQGEL